MSIIDYFRPKTKEKLLRGEYVHWIENNGRADYIRQCVLSFPPWVIKADLIAIWDECRRLEEETGVKHNLDHIIPLNHPRVCGLSVPWNIQPLTQQENNRKGNAWNEHEAIQTDLFDLCQ